ncbi:hypothetical protein [Clostridium sp. YIM B02569]|uniref:hypothetical protein n=1 Tax=Clostridium sp. YIM B02569 TaxID=2911967 RepID=UPI001EECBC2D|nr:hypothetical protein [Clostridium sp. YIM B02569]
MKNDDLEKVKSIIRSLYGIALLEYEDKNLLSGDNKTRSEKQQALLQEAYEILNK